MAGFEKPWMLSYLEREGIFRRQHFKDKRHGRARKYTFADIVILRAINRLLEMGARPSRIRSILVELGKHKGLVGERAKVESLAMSLGTRLFVSEKEALILEDDQTVVDLLGSGQFAFGFMLNFGECVRPVAEVIKVYEEKRKGLWKQNRPVLEGLCVAAGI